LDTANQYIQKRVNFVYLNKNIKIFLK